MRGVKIVVYGLLSVPVLVACILLVGMIPVMVILLHEFPASDDPWEPLFWFRMSMAAVVGGVIAFPINWWLVAKGIKHGCMTIPEKAPAHSDDHAGHDMPMDHDMHGDHCMKMTTLPAWQQLAWVLGTFGLLAIAVWITTMFAPIKF